MRDWVILPDDGKGTNIPVSQLLIWEVQPAFPGGEPYFLSRLESGSRGSPDISMVLM